MKGSGYAEYANLSSMVGVLIARDKATLHELQTVYSYEDALNLLEVITVHNYNEWVAAEASNKG